MEFLKEKKANTEAMSEFAQTIYGMAQAEVDKLIKINTDTAAQQTAYTTLTSKIKEIYDERIKELSED